MILTCGLESETYHLCSNILTNLDASTKTFFFSLNLNCIFVAAGSVLQCCAPSHQAMD